MTRDGFLAIDIRPGEEKNDPDGFIYHRFLCTDVVDPFGCSSTGTRRGMKVHRCGLLLPCLLDPTTSAPRYCAVSEQWEWFDGVKFTESCHTNWIIRDGV